MVCLGLIGENAHISHYTDIKAMEKKMYPLTVLNQSTMETGSCDSSRRTQHSKQSGVAEG